MTDTVVARRYAEALFALGKKQGIEALDAYGACLADLMNIISEQPKLEQVLKSPVISAEEKKKIMAALLDKMAASITMRNFCFLLADKQRIGALVEIAKRYRILLDAEHGVLRGRVVTAISLSPEKQAEISETLKKKSGSDVELTFAADPEILGGMVLSIGDKVLDSSLRAQLGILRETLRRGI